MQFILFLYTRKQNGANICKYANKTIQQRGFYMDKEAMNKDLGGGAVFPTGP